MATKDTGGQQRSTRRTEEIDEQTPEGVDTAEVSERKEQLDEDIDAILDEIDEALESNSEEFVRSFVQKGGQ
jgi:ubiquitin-like protein Pup